MMGSYRGRPCRTLAPMALLWLAGCASDGGFSAALDARPGACDTELQALRDQPPPPPGLSRSERGRYEERTRDYHVSSGCRRETEASIPLGGASRPRN